MLDVDIAGAFDRVSHAGVLHQAGCCGVSGDLLIWLMSYLCDRHLKAMASGQESPLYPVKAGVHQASILGPTLFLMYVNSCEDEVPRGVKLAVYADDTTLYSTKCSRRKIPSPKAVRNSKMQSTRFSPGAKRGSHPSHKPSFENHRPAWTVSPILFGGISVRDSTLINSCTTCL